MNFLRSESEVELILLLDEDPGAWSLAPARLEQAVGGLHKVFDRAIELTLVFCFTTTAPQTIARVIGETLYERRSETLTLPPLSRQEAVDFITELVREWSVDPQRAPFPFTSSAIGAVIDTLPADDGLIPRDLIRACDTVLRAADLDIEDGAITEIDAEYARARLAEEGVVE